MAGVQLYAYQLNALSKKHNGCILCGGVGSGKSRTSLAYFYTLYGGEVNVDDYVPMYDLDLPDLYIITTARKRDTLEWDKELVPFLLSTDPRHNLYQNAVIIDSWNNIKKYADVKNAFFIFDEQRVIGKGAWTKSFLKIAEHNQWILLSATPGDTWTDYIPVFIANGFFRNRTEFNDKHVVFKPFTRYAQIESYKCTESLRRLRSKILVNMDFRRETISHHEKINVGYDVTKYKQICRERWNPWEERPVENSSEFCYALRRASIDYYPRNMELLSLSSEHPKIIIFYNFNYELDAIKSLFKDRDIQIAEWNGHKHEPIPDSDRWIYCVQYFAGAEGWNCIQTDTIVFYSQNYSYKTMVQAAGRIDRLNTPFTDLYYYHFTSNSGIDRAINKALQEKKKFNENEFTQQSHFL